MDNSEVYDFHTFCIVPYFIPINVRIKFHINLDEYVQPLKLWFSIRWWIILFQTCIGFLGLKLNVHSAM